VSLLSLRRGMGRISTCGWITGLNRIMSFDKFVINLSFIEIQ
jgi:hypothetical protein